MKILRIKKISIKEFSMEKVRNVYIYNIKYSLCGASNTYFLN